MKSFISLLCALVLTACASSYVPVQVTYLERAERAVTEQKWEVAYRFLEDGLLSTNADSKAKAIALYTAHPQIQQAAFQTFSQEAIEKTLKDHGMSAGADIERKRLHQYAVVAPAEKHAAAETTLKGLVDGFERRQRAEREQQEAWAAKRKEDELTLARDFEASKAAAVFRCGDKLQCDKAFSLTQIFIATNSDMKIQLATDTLIETFNPNKEGSMGAMAMKLPLTGTSAEIRLSVSCKAGNKSIEENCKRDSIKMNRAFAQFLRERLLN